MQLQLAAPEMKHVGPGVSLLLLFEEVCKLLPGDRCCWLHALAQFCEGHVTRSQPSISLIQHRLDEIFLDIS